MTNSSFLKRTILALFVLSVTLFVSCDDDFNLLGADVIGGDIHSDMVPAYVDVVAYDRPTGSVQSNNMLENQLGIYDSPLFGKTVSHFVTQVVMASENPTIYDPIVDSVYLYVPYYATGYDATDDGETLYKWDNGYFEGDEAATFDLNVYRNGYYLRDSDPGATDKVQRYYSDDRQMVDNMAVTSLYHNPEFSFSRKELEIHAIQTDGTDKLVERKKPGMLFYFDPAVMKEMFFSEANKGNLVNNSVFKDYFRGLYFKVTQTSGAAMSIPDFSGGFITFKIHDYETKIDGGVAGPDTSKPRTSKTITFNLKGNTINFFDNTYSGGFNTAMADTNPDKGDSELYLKGGAGSMAIINLDYLGLKELKDNIGKGADNNVLINEANLVFYIKKDIMVTHKAAPRIYLYDLETRRPIIDYSMDATKTLGNAKYDKYIYGGIIDTLKNGDIQYKLRLTNHIKNIIKGDSLDTVKETARLGLVVTDNINITTNNRLKTPFTEGSGESATEVREVPYASVQDYSGVILHGTDPADEKRIKLEIYYSKPKE